ncbi:MAG TPA: serine/threonine-protein kinase [Polyangia bacterium]|jgi:serine/threonine-protein kinase|nr:serine/threonine-protein kinase [Polyangia bacterium]
MQHCPHCRTELEDGARFCGACGRRIDPPASTPASPAPPASAARPSPAAASPAAQMSAGSGPSPASPAVVTQIGSGATNRSGAVGKRPVEPLAATMLSSGPLSGSPLAAVMAGAAAPANPAPPITAAPTVAGSQPPGFAGLALPGAAPGGGAVRPAARPAETFVGRILNHRYVVEDKIGEGGFGAVFRGKQIATGREVALKILHPHNSGDPTIVARFRREAEACSKLRDPHTVTTYDFDETEDGVLYLAMELLRGKSLHLLQKSDGPFDVERVLGILEQVADSLGEAHQNGIVHRDMKPENVIVETRAGNDYVKVLDFGIAKMISGDREVQALTAVGQTLGTLEFMSPEQLRGIKLDGRSDIYALGMMAYEMLTGELPFKSAKTPIEIINFHMKDICPPPSKLRPDLNIPAAIDALILKMVAKSRDSRFSDTTALRAAIDQARHDDGKSSSFRLPFSDPRLIGLMGVVAVAVVGAVVYFLAR